MHHLILIFAFGLGGLWRVLSSPALPLPQKTDPPSPLPGAVVAAWTSAGAEFGWFSVDQFGRDSAFKTSNDGPPGNYPAFRFLPHQAIRWQELKDVGQPFGLALRRTLLRDPDMEKLAQYRKLRSVDLAYTSVSDTGLQNLAALKDLERLYLAGCTRISRQGLASLPLLPRLECLDASQLNVIGVDWSAIAPKLKSLNLHGAAIGDEDLKTLTALNDLQALDLGTTRLTDGCAKHVKSLIQLRELEISFSGFSLSGLKELRGLKHLTTLALGPGFTDEGCSELAVFKELTNLDLSGTTVTDSGLKQLAGRNLHTLVLPPSARTDLGLERYLAAVEPFSALDLISWNISPEGLKLLAGRSLKSLIIPADLKTDDGLKGYLDAIAAPTSLDLYSWARLTDNGLAALADQTQLESLCLRGSHIHDAGMKHLRDLKDLRDLDIRDLPVGARGLKELSDLKELRRINLVGTRVTDEGLKTVAGFQQLQVLMLGSTKITDAGLQELVQLKHLKTLDLSFCKITDKGLNSLIGLSDLETLNLVMSRITPDAIAKLRQSLPNVKVLSGGVK
jgi:Leucine-rich repeat (LRR) protein